MFQQVFIPDITMVKNVMSFKEKGKKLFHEFCELNQFVFIDYDSVIYVFNKSSERAKTNTNWMYIKVTTAFLQLKSKLNSLYQTFNLPVLQQNKQTNKQTNKYIIWKLYCRLSIIVSIMIAFYISYYPIQY